MNHDPIPGSIEDLENICDYIDQNLHHWCKLISAHRFYTWLRSKQVLSDDDVDEIESARPGTRTNKNCKLLDIIKTKGRNGFVAFMEVIEYEYPDHFANLTQREPRRPPVEFTGSLRCHTFLLTDLIPKLTEVMSEREVMRKEEGAKRQEAEQLLKEIQNENAILKTKIDDLADLEGDWQSLLLKENRWLEEKGQLQDECKQLMRAHQERGDVISKVTKERDDALRQIEEFKRALDDRKIRMSEMESEVTFARKNSQKLQDKVKQQDHKSLKRENELLKERLEQLEQRQLSSEEGIPPSSIEDTAALEAKVDILKQELDDKSAQLETTSTTLTQLREEFEDLETEKNKLDGSYEEVHKAKVKLERECQVLRDRCNDYYEQCNKIKHERDEVAAQRAASQNDWIEKTKAFDEKTAEIHSLYERIESLENDLQLATLQNEQEHRGACMIRQDRLDSSDSGLRLSSSSGTRSSFESFGSRNSTEISPISRTRLNAIDPAAKRDLVKRRPRPINEITDQRAAVELGITLTQRKCGSPEGLSSILKKLADDTGSWQYFRVLANNEALSEHMTEGEIVAIDTSQAGQGNSRAKKVNTRSPEVRFKGMFALPPGGVTSSPYLRGVWPWKALYKRPLILLSSEISLHDLCRCLIEDGVCCQTANGTISRGNDDLLAGLYARQLSGDECKNATIEGLVQDVKESKSHLIVSVGRDDLLRLWRLGIFPITLVFQTTAARMKPSLSASKFYTSRDSHIEEAAQFMEVEATGSLLFFGKGDLIDLEKDQSPVGALPQVIETIRKHQEQIVWLESDLLA